MMTRKIVLLVIATSLCGHSVALTVTPQLVSPINSIKTTGDILIFDLVVASSLPANKVNTFQATVSYAGPGNLKFSKTYSEAVDSGVSSYWIHGNSIGASAKDLGGGVCDFSDTADDPASEILNTGDILARFAFEWDGTPGEYTFTLDQSTLKSFITVLPNYLPEGLSINPGQFKGTDASFTVYVPEPVSLVLLGLGGFLIYRKQM